MDRNSYEKTGVDARDAAEDALTMIRALCDEVESKEGRIEELEDEVSKLKGQNIDLEGELKEVRANQGEWPR